MGYTPGAHPPHCRIVWADCIGRTRRLFAVRTWEGWDCRVGGYAMPGHRFQRPSQTLVIAWANWLCGGWGGSWRARWLDEARWDGVHDSGYGYPTLGQLPLLPAFTDAETFGVSASFGGGGASAVGSTALLSQFETSGIAR